MESREIHSEAFLPDKEILLNRPFFARGEPALLAAVTSQEGTCSAWVLYHRPAPKRLIEQGEYVHFPTNRLERFYSAFGSHLNWFHTQSAVIQGHTLSFSSCQSNLLSHCSPEESARLQHFLEKGIDLTPFNQYPAETICITECHFENETFFSDFDPDRPLDISLTVGADNIEHCIGNIVHTLKPGEIINERFVFSEGKGYYLNALVFHDIHAETEAEYTDEQIRQMEESGLTQEQIAEMNEQYAAALFNLCPKDHVLLMLEYESEDDIQLTFYDKAFLDAPPDPPVSGSMGMIAFSGSADLGPHGHRLQYCMIRPVPKAFDEAVEIELFSWYEVLKEETIRLD